MGHHRIVFVKFPMAIRVNTLDLFQVVELQVSVKIFQPLGLKIEIVKQRRSVGWFIEKTIIIVDTRCWSIVDIHVHLLLKLTGVSWEMRRNF